MPTYTVVNGENPGPMQHPAITLVDITGAPYDTTESIQTGAFRPSQRARNMAIADVPMASPVTISASTSSAPGGTYQTRVQPATDARIKVYNMPTVENVPGGLAARSAYNTAGNVISTYPIDFAFSHYGLTWVMQYLANSGVYRIWVNGVPHVVAPVAHDSVTGAVRYVTITHADTGWHDIVIEGENGFTLAGVYAETTGVIGPPLSQSKGRVAFLSDSIGAGNGGTLGGVSRIGGGWVRDCCRILGIFDTRQVSCIGGTGYVRDNSGGGFGAYTNTSRLDGDIIAQAPDAVVLCGTINDSVAIATEGKTLADLDTAMRAVVARIRAALPNVILIQTGPMNVPWEGSTAGIEAKYLEVATALGIPYIDTTNWTTTTDAVFIGDGTHPNAAGHRHLARLMAPRLAPHLGVLV